MKNDLLSHLDQMPPLACRLVARHRSHKLMSLRMLKQMSGLSMNMVKRLSTAITWENVRIADAIAFASACGVNLLKPRPKRFYLKRVLDGPTPIKTLAGKATQEEYVTKLLKHYAEKATD